jgi:signal peptidase I
MSTLSPDGEERTPEIASSPVPETPAKLCFRLPGRTPSVLRKPVGASFILAIVIGVIILRGWLIEGVIVDGDSMYSTLHNGQRLLVLQKHYNSDRRPRRGDIVVLRDPQEKSMVVKRVIALPSDNLVMNGTQVLINNELLEEPYAHGKQTAYLMGRLPRGTVWVLGDNRDNSIDSRVYGPVPLSDIRGRAIFSFWPLHTIARQSKLK